MKKLASALLLSLVLSACGKSSAPKPSANSKPPVVQEQNQQGGIQFLGNSLGYTDGNQGLLQQMLSDILRAEQQMFGCNSIEAMQAEVTQQSNQLIQELWLIQACNTVHRYSAQFTPGANGPEYSLSLLQ